jgi:hypothetical protein
MRPCAFEPPEVHTVPMTTADTMSTPSTIVAVLRTAGCAFWLRAAAYGAGALLFLGIPTVLIPNTLFARMIEAQWWTYGLWVASALLAGLVLAARGLPRAACRVEGRTAAGGGLAFLAVACPTCNLLVVSALGVSGAMSVFAPIQPLLGLAGVTVLGLALARIVRTTIPEDGTDVDDR